MISRSSVYSVTRLIKIFDNAKLNSNFKSLHAL